MIRTSLSGLQARTETLLRQILARRSPMAEEAPLRAELLSADQMERYGKTLAGMHRLATGRSRDQLLPRLAANETVLGTACKQLTKVAAGSDRISPAGEWLLDNFHLISEQIATAKRHLPRGYSRALPQLALGTSAGRPRVYDIALRAIAHGDGRVDVESLTRFVAAYQTVTTLDLGELWAIPIMLRLALIENLRRVAGGIANGRSERDLANAWADRMIATAEQDPKGLILVVADMARSTPPMESAFVAELARRLQGQSAALTLGLTWIEQRLAESHQTIERMVLLENQRQASAQVSMSNSIGSLRLLGAVDWREFVETTSVVEEILRQDPAGTYAAMAFVTRDEYRHATERIAREGRLTEPQVARLAIELAGEARAAKGSGERAAHVGFHLVDKGLPRLEAAANVADTPVRRIRRLGARFPLPAYLGSIAALTGMLATGLVVVAQRGTASAVAIGFVTMVALLAASQVAVTVVNWLVMLLATPRLLPRMAFATGIEAQARTLVVVPTFLVDERNAEELLEALEVRFLANREPHLHFGLLTDFPDAPHETLEGDAALLRLLETGIADLNVKYTPAAAADPEPQDAASSLFYLFHRSRRWNAAARIWMGEERKRGKLGDLNALLRGKAHGFSVVVGHVAILADVKYVITLDTDTQLPRDAARLLVAAMAHPLNRPEFTTLPDGGREVVTAGHGILQPRVAVSLPGTNRSHYARLHGSDAGVDQYTRTVSDVYQDAFDEGSFVGKGIYDVDAFERALKDRFPRNRILSHDLLEGCYVRSGFMSDAELYEESPARYSADVARRRRWIRGDWQLVGWLRRHVPGLDGRRERNPLSFLSQWKLFDNLRRSLVSPALVALAVLGWTILGHAAFWTGVVVAVVALPGLVATLSALVAKPRELSLQQHLAFVGGVARRTLAQALLTLALLPYEACYCLEAIGRAIIRMLFAPRHLLAWNPSSAAASALEQPDRTGLAASWHAMIVAPAVAVGAGTALALMHPAALVVAAPILLLWAASPAITWWMSRPLQRRAAPLTRAKTSFLRALARRTWAYFEAHMTAEDHWLPPDNVQQHPDLRVAHRTSPTNMGLVLLANLSAHDFGYLTGGQLIARTASTLGSMQLLERYRGHFYNWYDTQTLLPLPPLYVSTVDSGNLGGHLLTLGPGLAELCDMPILAPRWVEGLTDTLAVLLDALGDHRPAPVTRFGTMLATAAPERGSALVDAWRMSERLVSGAAEVVAHFDRDDATEGTPDAALWAAALAGQCEALRDELVFVAPWLALPAFPADVLHDLAVAVPTLRAVASFDTAWRAHLERARALASTSDAHDALEAFERLLVLGAQRARERMTQIEALRLVARTLATVDYSFLFDKVRRQLAIGYNVSQHRRDESYYDLLASETRLCNFVAIAQHELPQESWFALGRMQNTVGGSPVLLSWSGSMFEYLMPLLVMPTYENTLLDQTYAAVVERQIDYGRQRGVPWGMSEGGYNAVDVNLNYQYRAFGVPGLGLKRGLGEDLVVAPYASALALMVAPEAACSNLQRLAAAGLAGRLGLYEAIDYTPSRQRRGEASAIVRSYMAHHQAMSLLACAYALLGQPMQRRFEAEPLLQATLLLLQERIPRATRAHAQAAELDGLRVAIAGPEFPVRVLTTPDTSMPEVQLLSNGRYHVMVTHAGGGSSRWKNLAVTRWREDGTCDNWGTFCYVREVAGGQFWSTAHQPTCAQGNAYESIFSEGRAEFRRTDLDFETHTEIVVSPEDDIELRRVRITNRARTARTVDVTSYAEVALAPPDADVLHPAFSNLFVQTEILRSRDAILCTRRARSREEAVPWMFHLMTVHGAAEAECSFETDRARFLGRRGTVAAPLAMIQAGRLSDTEGSVLDPITAIRQKAVIAAGATVTIDLVVGAGDSRDAVLHLVDKYRDRGLADRVFELTWTHSQIVLRQLNATEADSQLYARLASAVIYATPAWRAPGTILGRNRRGQSSLWGYAISGDLPIVLLQIADAENIELVRQLVQAHAYWRLKGLAVDLVIWNEGHDGYRQPLQEQIVGLIAAGVEAHFVDRPGGIFIRHAEQMSVEDRILFQSVARVIISDSRGTLAEQVNMRPPVEPRVARHAPSRARRPEAAVPLDRTVRDLLFHNGTGGFTADGREYVIAPRGDVATPAPWANVMANPRFGTVVSESSLGYTWVENAHQFRLTPWHNDPVGDPSGEAIFIRDEETGHVWSPATPGVGDAPRYVTRHGFGHTVFEHAEEGIHSELTVFVAHDAAVKFYALKVTNRSGRTRRLAVTGYVEWVLGDVRARSAMHVTTEIDARNGALYARNPYNGEFPDWVAFFDVDEPTRTVTGSRLEFIGRNGTLRAPAALRRARLSGRTGAGLDPCAAMQVIYDLDDGQERETVFRLGAASHADEAGRLVQRFRGAAAAHDVLQGVVRYWRHALGALEVRTPEPALDLLANGWLVYQTIACRLWARSGYYQSGGAYGFRDQLQDAMALVHTDPGLLRAQIALCASRQFIEGDVQHWWHPPSGRGVRTHCSDDYLWLPLATCRYVAATGDTSILDQTVPFLEGRAVNPRDDSYYDLPGQADEVANVYQHCVRALVHGLRFGVHGLPLMGSGDWNDGMNLVGRDGKGESVWLAFFLHDVLVQFADVARARRDTAFAERCIGEAAQLRQRIEQHGWDGAWYRRAYFDDGTPLGSSENPECRIDSIAQSWSALSGAGDPARSALAMSSLYTHLVRSDDGVIRLLDPPFDTSALDPGYIRGYVPGVRENGGQYTHAAIWAAMAFAAQGDAARAWELTSIINPINHARTPDEVARYKVEPYVVAADVYGLAPHAGRGGWSWYTGSAGWMYRLIVESLLGVTLHSGHLHFKPCMPPGWNEFTMRYRYRETTYDITVRRSEHGEDGTSTDAGVSLDGVLQESGTLLLVDDRQAHVVDVRAGPASAA